MDIGIGIGGTTVGDVIKAAQKAKDDGFIKLNLSNIFGLDAVVASAVAGSHVDDVTFTTAVVPTIPRHPHTLAQAAMTAHDATGGRFTLGIGVSHQIVIETMFGLSYDRPAAQTREYLDVLLPLLREGNAGFNGEYYNVHAPLERASDDHGPPVLIAALAPIMLKLAGERADGTVLWMTGHKTIADHVAPRITKAAADAGRPSPTISAALPIALTNDVDALVESASEEFAVYGGLPSYRAMLDKEGAAGPADVSIIGDEATLTAGLQQLRDAGLTDYSAALFGDAETQKRTRSWLKDQL